MDKIFLEFLAKTLNITIEQAAELLYEDPNATEKVLKNDALAAILQKDADRVKAIKEGLGIDPQKEKDLRDEGYRRAEKEIMTNFEKSVREEYGIESEAQGVELIKAVVQKSVQGVKGGELTDDKVKAHPLYTQLEKRMNDELAKLKTDHQSQIDNMKAEHEKEGTLSKVKGIAKTMLASFNPLIAENTVVAANRETDFLEKFAGYDYQFDDKGNVSLIIDKDGKRLENAQGHAVKFNDFVKEKADLYYEYKKQDQKGDPNGGTNDGQNPPAGGSKFNIPKSEEEYYQKLGELSSSEDRAAYTKLYEESKSQ